MNALTKLAFAGTFLLASCHPSPSGTSLSISSIYSIDTVRLAAETGSEDAADSKLKDALDSYRKKGADTSRSIQLFKASILLHPTAKAYFELAGALLSSQQYDEGLKALSVAEGLGYSPMANVMFRYAYAYAHLSADNGSIPNSGYVVRYMELAIQMGYAHPRQFLQRDLFPDAARKTDFDVVFTNAMSGSAVRDPARPLWDAFSDQFPEMPVPIVIDLQWMHVNKLDHPIDFQFEKFIPDMREAKFSREGGTTYYYLARLHQDQSFVAFLYGEVDDEVEGDESQLPLCTLATYNRQGKLIDRMAVAGRKSLSDPFKVFNIRSDLKFSVQGFRDIYREDPDSAGYKDNEIIRKEPGAAETYQIAANGKFEPAAAPLARR